MLQTSRRPGDPIPPDLILEYRKRAGLTQDELALRLGLAGKAVVSAWETGRTKCEGPAAEFLLHLSGRGNAAVEIPALTRNMDEIWDRTKAPLTSWRQIAAVPARPLEIEPARFVGLFPAAALPLADVQHGYPFTGEDLPGNVCGVSPSGWVGCIPASSDRQPAYLWLFKRDGKFAYRERLWEDDLSSTTHGDFDVGTILIVALQTTFFIKRLATLLSLDKDLELTFQLDLHGSRGKGVADALDPNGRYESKKWSEDHASAAITASVEDLSADPKAEAFRLTSEVVLQVSADFAQPKLLAKILKAQEKGSRQMGFLKNL